MLELTGMRRPRNRTHDRDSRRLDARATATVWGTIEVRFELGSVTRGSEFVVVIDQSQFGGLAKEMLRAHPALASQAFRSALEAPSE
jgi:hypothetical protein